MKIFLSVTAILEGITGVVLFLIPQWVVSLLLSITLQGNDGIIAARVAGITMIILAIVCWFSRKKINNSGIMTALLFYNSAIIAIFLVAFFVYGLNGIFFWLVVAAHTLLCVWGLVLMKKH